MFWEIKKESMNFYTSLEAISRKKYRGLPAKDKETLLSFARTGWKTLSVWSEMPLELANDPTGVALAKAGLDLLKKAKMEGVALTELAVVALVTDKPELLMWVHAQGLSWESEILRVDNLKADPRTYWLTKAMNEGASNCLLWMLDQPVWKDLNELKIGPSLSVKAREKIMHDKDHDEDALSKFNERVDLMYSEHPLVTIFNRRTGRHKINQKAIEKIGATPFFKQSLSDPIIRISCILSMLKGGESAEYQLASQWGIYEDEVFEMDPSLKEECAALILDLAQNKRLYHDAAAPRLESLMGWLEKSNALECLNNVNKSQSHLSDGILQAFFQNMHNEVKGISLQRHVRFEQIKEDLNHFVGNWPKWIGEKKLTSKVSLVSPSQKALKEAREKITDICILLDEFELQQSRWPADMKTAQEMKNTFYDALKLIKPLVTDDLPKRTLAL